MTTRNHYRFDDVEVDSANFRVSKGGATTTLGPRAFDLLVYLIERRGRVVEKQQLFDEVWDGAFVTDNALTKAIKEIRQAIGDEASAPRYIETVPRRGYRFVAEVTEARPQVSSSPIEPIPDAPAQLVGRRVPIALVATAAAVLVVLAAVVGRSLLAGAAAPEAAPPDVARTVQLTTWSGLDMFPEISPDGTRMAYCSDRSGTFEVYVRQLAPGGRDVQITSDGAINVEPSWSPDGSVLAYHSQQRGGVWVVPALGGVTRRVSEFGSRPRWSPDGTSIAFQSDELTDIGPVAFGAMPPSTLWLVAAGGGDGRQLTTRDSAPGGHGSPAWSPDGRRLAFVSYGSVSDAVWTVAADGGPATLVVEGDAVLFDPVWSPDGASIYYVGVSRATKSANVMRVPVAADTGGPVGAPERVADTGRVVSRHLSFSPDGKRLVYSAVAMRSDIWSVSVAPATGEASGEPVALTSDTSFRKSTPSFSRDGTRVAYSSKLTGATVDVWTVGADGGAPTQLTSGPGMNAFPSWFPDGRRIAFMSRAEGAPVLRAFDFDTGVARDLFTWSAGINFPRVSPDGNRVAFHSDRGGVVNVWMLSLQSGDPVQVTFDAELAGWPCWSPDGSTLAVELRRGNGTQLGLVASGGGEIRQLTSEPGQSWTGSWSPDGDRIAFAGQRDGIWNVWWVSRSTGAERRVTAYTRPNAYVRAPDWSPKGDRIVYEYAEVTGNIWLMELGAPKPGR